MGIFNGGGILSAIFPPKLIKRYYSDPLQQNVDDMAGVLSSRRSQDSADLDRFSAGVRTAGSDLDALKIGDMSQYGSMIDRLVGTDPLALRGQVADQNFDAFDKYVKRIGSETSLNDKITSARLGFGGRPGNSYTTQLIADRTSRNLSPALAALLANLGADTSRLQSDARSNNSQADSLINARADVPLRGLKLLAAPIDARNAASQAENAALLGAIQNALANFSGYEKKDNKWAAAAGALDEVGNSAVNIAMQLVPLLAGGMGGGAGGLLGGLLGGGKGGGGGGSSVGSAVPNFSGRPLPTFNYGSYGLLPQTQPTPTYGGAPLPGFDYSKFGLTPGG